MLDDPVAAIHQRYARSKIRHIHIAILRVTEMARHDGALDEVDVLPVESKPLDAVISPVCDEKNWLFIAANIHDDAVRATYLAGLIPYAAEGPDVLALVVVLIDIAG